MKKIIFGLLFIVGANSSIAAPSKCDLQVYFQSGVYGEPASYFDGVKSTLKSKGYTNIQFIESSDKFKKLVLSFGTETPGFRMSEQAWMVLSDETKVTTSEKYLYSSQRGSYFSGAAPTFLKLIRELPGCRP
jgi:hypothetical protein